jgi:hypothetical protein
MKQEIMAVLANFFLPRLKKKECKTLPPLPPFIRAELERYNNIVSTTAENTVAAMKSLGFADPKFPEPKIPLHNSAVINSYALDFYVNGSKDHLLRWNELSDNKAYRLLKEWNGLLKKIAQALKHLSMVEKNPVTLALIDISSEFNDAFNRITY